MKQQVRVNGVKHLLLAAGLLCAAPLALAQKSSTDSIA